MAVHGGDIVFGTGIDKSGLNKGLNEAASEADKSATKITRNFRKKWKDSLSSISKDAQAAAKAAESYAEARLNELNDIHASAASVESALRSNDWERKFAASHDRNLLWTSIMSKEDYRNERDWERALSENRKGHKRSRRFPDIYNYRMGFRKIDQTPINFKKLTSNSRVSRAENSYSGPEMGWRTNRPDGIKSPMITWPTQKHHNLYPIKRLKDKTPANLENTISKTFSKGNIISKALTDNINRSFSSSNLKSLKNKTPANLDKTLSKVADVKANTGNLAKSLDEAKKPLKEFDTLEKTVSNNTTKALKQVTKETNKALSSARSEVMKLAAEYRKQGLDKSEALKKAWATKNAVSKGFNSGNLYSKPLKSAADNIFNVSSPIRNLKESISNEFRKGNILSKALSDTANRSFNVSGPIKNLSKVANNTSKQISSSMDKAAKNATKSFKNSFGQIGNLGIGLSTKLAKLFTFSYITRQLSRMFKSVLDAGGQFEQMTQGMQILFADTRKGANATAEEVNHAYNQMFENAIHAYKDTGMSANEYMDTAASFATRITQETKGDTEAAAGIIDTMMKDMSDNWHLLGGDFEMIQNAYSGLLRGNYRMFDNLKLGYGQTKAEVERLLADAEKLSGVHYDINNLSDIIKAVHEIQEATGMTGTTAREAMTTWAGATNMLAKSWENFKSMVGQGLIWLLQPVLQVIGKIADALTAVAYRFMMWAKNIMGIKDLIVGRQSNKEYKQAAANIGSINTGLGGTGEQAKAAKKAVKDLKRELLGFDKITKLSGEKGTNTGGTGTTGSSGTGGGLGDDEEPVDQTWLDRQVQQAQDYLSKIKLPEALITAINHLKTAFKELFDILADAGKWVYDNVLEPLGKWTINEATPRVVEVLASAVKVINEVLKTLGVILEPIWEHLLKPIAQALGDVFLVVLDALKGALDFIAAALKVVRAVLEPLWEPLIKPLCEFLAKNVVKAINEVKDAIEIIGKVLEIAAKGLEKFAGWIKTLPEKWANFKKNVKDFVLNIKIPTWSDIKSALDTLLGKIWEKIRSGAAKIGIKLPTWSELKEKVAQLKEKIYNKIRDGAAKVGIKLPTWSEFKDRVAQLKERFKSAFKGISASFSLKFSTAVGDLKSWINKNLIDKINNKFKSIPILRNHLIQRLAQGGFVKANTPQLAMIGDNRYEGEIVAPESKLAAMAAQAAQAAAGSSNDETNMLLRQLIALVAGLNLNVQLDGEQIKNNTVRRINNHTRSTGQLEIII